MISCEEIGETTHRSAVCEQPRPFEISARLSVANETLNDVSGTVCWQLRENTGEIIKRGEEKIKVEKLSSKWLEKMDFDGIDYKSNYLSYQFVVDGEIVSEDCVLFTAPKHFEFEKPTLSAKIIGDEVEISSDVFAYGIRVLADDDTIFSDNYFSLNGDTKRIKILSGNPKTITLKSVYDIK